MTVFAALILIGSIQADVSLKDAIKIGEKNFKDLVNQFPAFLITQVHHSVYLLTRNASSSAN